MEETALIVQNTEELNRLEQIIKRNLASFYEVGRALIEIRDKRLYCDVKGYDTFEAYCKKEWEFNASRARQLIGAARTYDNIKSVTIVTPVTESQARPLAKLEPEQQREAWQQAVETAPAGKVTAAHVAKTVKEITPKIAPLQTNEHTKEEPPEEDSDALYQLKRWWKLATKKDQRKFMKWVKENANG